MWLHISLQTYVYVLGTYEFECNHISDHPSANLSGADLALKAQSVAPPIRRRSPTRRLSTVTDSSIMRALSAGSLPHGHNKSKKDMYATGPDPSTPRRPRGTEEKLFDPSPKLFESAPKLFEPSSKSFGFTRAMSTGSPPQVHDRSKGDIYAPNPTSPSPRRRRYTEEEVAFSGFSRAMSAGTPVHATHSVSGPLPISHNLDVPSKTSSHKLSSGMPAKQPPTPKSSSRSHSPNRRGSQKVISSGAAFYSRVIAQQTQHQQQLRPSV